MKLNSNEIQKLSSGDLKRYTSLDETGQLMFSVAWRESELQKTETRGRHKKDCDCEKCSEKRLQRDLLIQQTEKEKPNEKENEKPLEQKTETVNENIQITEQDIEVGKEVEKVLQENKVLIEEKKPEPKIEDASKNLDSDLDQFKKSQEKLSDNSKPIEQTQAEIIDEKKKAENKQTMDLTAYISGAMLLTGCDYFFPMVIKLMVGFFMPKYRYINEAGFDSLTLTPMERTYLEPSAEMMCKFLFKDAHPIIVFGFFAGSIYGGKFVRLNDKHFDLPEKQEKKEKK